MIVSISFENKAMTANLSVSPEVNVIRAVGSTSAAIMHRNVPHCVTRKRKEGCFFIADCSTSVCNKHIRQGSDAFAQRKIVSRPNRSFSKIIIVVSMKFGNFISKQSS